MNIDFLLDIFEKNKENDAIIWEDEAYGYKWLLGRIDYWRREIRSQDLKSGTIVALEADFSPNSVALFFALAEHDCVIVPLARVLALKREKFMEISQTEVSISVDKNDNVEFKRLINSAYHEYYDKLRQSGCPGLVLFSSGSTGENKAIVHDLKAVLDKYKVRRRPLRTITFLLYDHIGGINTMLHTLSNGGCLITVENRHPDEVLKAIEKHRAVLFPTTPTFINLILLSEAYKRWDISSLELISYGTEPMPESTLKRFHELFPYIRLVQTYGLSEVGILRSKSIDSNSLWVKVGGEGFKIRVVDGLLQIKAHSAMLGYLNAPSPFIEDGWFNTGDEVEVNGEYIKILGRRSEIINVGGEKVYPAEVEGVIKEIDNVKDVIIYAEKSPITGNIVCAKVALVKEEDKKDFILRLKKYCIERMDNYKIPIKVFIVDEIRYSDRFKKNRALT